MSRTEKSARLLFSILGFFVLSGCGSQRMSTEQLHETMKSGDQIVAAVRSYRSDQLALPSSLDMLSPKYIKSLPPTGFGEAYTLFTDVTGGFLLCFDYQRGVKRGACCFIDRVGIWDCSPPGNHYLYY